MSDKITTNQDRVLEEDHKPNIESEGRPLDTKEDIPGYIKGETPEQAAQRVEKERQKPY